jgi:transposase-like protein
MTKLTVKAFFDRFPDDNVCLQHVMDLRYGRVRDCPKCGKATEFYPLTRRPAYSCKLCGHHIYPCAGTPFERTRTPLQSWFYAIYLFTTTRHGVPAKELQRQLGVTYKTAWRMGHEIRKYMGMVDGDGGLSGTVEVDETYVGGKEHGLKKEMGRPSALSKKTAVFGMVERGGDVMTRVVPECKTATLIPIIEDNVEKGTLINSDENKIYRNVRKLGYGHVTVNHSAGEYVRGPAYTNTIEGFWSHFKNSVRGTHKSISRKHMQKYLVEFEFRFNLRGPQAPSMFDRLIQAF